MVKKLALVFVFLVAIIGVLLLRYRPAQGLVTVDTVETAAGSRTLTMTYQGDHVRRDAGNGESIIYDLKTGGVVVLDHQRKMFTRYSLAQMIAKEKASLGMAPDSSGPPDLVDTGRKEKVGVYDAEVYTTEIPTAKFTCWIVKDYPDADAINDQVRKYRLMEKLGGIFPDIAKVGGIRVKSQVAPGSGKTSTSTMVSIRIEPVRDSVFMVPADYKEAAASPTATP